MTKPEGTITMLGSEYDALRANWLTEQQSARYECARADRAEHERDELRAENERLRAALREIVVGAETDMVRQQDGLAGSPGA